MKFIFLQFVALTCYLCTFGQITFERTYPVTTFNSIEEMNNGDFIGSGDSLQNGFMFQTDRYGNIVSTFFPKLRNNKVLVEDITKDHISGGYAICGTSEDTTGNNFTAYYLLLDANLQSQDSIFYNGGVNGPSSDMILKNSHSDFILSIGTFHGAGTYSTGGQKISYPSTNSWFASGGSNHSPNGMAIDKSDKLILASFNWVSASAARLLLFDTTGQMIHTFTITDTAFGGSLVFQSYCSTTMDGNYMFGVNLNPNTGTYTVPYVAKLDSTLNVIWVKYLDWGYSVGIIGITHTQDSCNVILLSTEFGMALHKVSPSGDSLWTQFHNRPTTGSGIRFEECADEGFVIVGQFYDTTSYGYILKTDSLGRLLPDQRMSINGSLEFCDGDTTILSAASGFNYLWSTGDTIQEIPVTTSGDYFVTVTDSAGLQSISDTISILVHTPSPPTITQISDTLYSSIASTYQWYLNDTLIVGATNLAHTATANGMYMVETTDSNGCHSFSAEFDLTTVAIQNIAINSLDAIFTPNPTSNQGTLVLHGIHSEKLEVTLLNQMGQKFKTIFKGDALANDANLLVDFSNNNSGVYVIRIIAGDVSTNLRVLVLK